MKTFDNKLEVAGSFLIGAAVGIACTALFHAFRKCKTDPRFSTRYDTNPLQDVEGKFTHFFKEEERPVDISKEGL